MGRCRSGTSRTLAHLGSNLDVLDVEYDRHVLTSLLVDPNRVYCSNESVGELNISTARVTADSARIALSHTRIAHAGAARHSPQPPVPPS